MLHLTNSRRAARIAALALTALFGISLSACNGGSNNVPGFGTQNGFFRFVDGSPDAGSLDVYVDGKKLNSSGPITYGMITAYNQYSVGSHTITINTSGTSTAISFTGGSQGVNGAQYVSLVLTGEVHGGTALNLVPFTGTTFSTSSGQMAVNIRNASPAMGSTTFGYYFINTPATTGTIGTGPVSVGGSTQPQGIPATALSTNGTNIPVGFYAGSPTTVTISPSEVDPTGCAANTLPCNSGSLSLYLIDGPAASTSPSPGPYPQGITASQRAGFVGIFDATGT